MRVFSLVAAAALVLSTSSALWAAEEQLRWKFAPGDELHYQMQQETQSRTQVGERDLKSSVQQVIDQSWRVKNVADDGSAELGLVFDRVVIKYDTPNGLIQLDTAGKVPAIGELADAERALRALTGTELSVQMSSLGEITEIELPEDLRKLVAEAQNGGALESSISEEGLRGMIALSTIVMPSMPVKPGDSWTEERNQLGTRLVLQYKYAGKEQIGGEELATVDVSGELSLDQQPVSELQLKLSHQDVKGVIHFDSAAGRLHDMQVTQRTAVDLTSGDTAGRQEVQVMLSTRLVSPGSEPDDAAASGE